MREKYIEQKLVREVLFLQGRRTAHDNRFPAVHIWMFDPQYWHRALRLVGRLTICDWQKQRDMRV